MDIIPWKGSTGDFLYPGKVLEFNLLKREEINFLKENEAAPYILMILDHYNNQCNYWELYNHLKREYSDYIINNSFNRLEELGVIETLYSKDSEEYLPELVRVCDEYKPDAIKGKYLVKIIKDVISKKLSSQQAK